jgi:NosR/NirI family nitrous oxide reductase transcriptional regulator
MGHTLKMLAVLAGLLAVAAASHAIGSEAILPDVRTFFPEADAVGAFEGDPPAAAVSRGPDVVGYVLLTDEVEPIPAYSGKPIKTLVGIDLGGHVRGAKILSHEEPILRVGISDRDLARFIGQYAGTRVTDRVKIGGRDREGYVTLDGISGATITVMVLNASITRSARKVAAARGLPRESSDLPGAGAAEPESEPVWVLLWRERTVQIAVLVVGLVTCWSS